MTRLHLVRHGRPLVDPAAPADEWLLDPSGAAEVRALGGAGRLPLDVPWYASPEPKALATAHLLAHPGDAAEDRAAVDAHRCGCDAVVAVPELAEHRRGVHWFDDPAQFRDAVARAFRRPEEPAAPTWEPLARTRERLLPAVRRILDAHPATDVVLVGHGTAWTLLRAELTRTPPDLDAWRALRMPDVWTVTPA